MLIGSNNTLTYLEPCGYWFKVFKFLGKKQSRDYRDQYTYGGCRYFDFKLTVAKNNRITVRNRCFIYNIFSIYEVMDYLNKMGDTIAHVSLDVTASEWVDDTTKTKENKFKDYCRTLETIYENIRFCGGDRIFDGENLYQFKNTSPSVFIAEKESIWYKLASMVSPKITRWLNDKYKKKYSSLHNIILLNHV